MKKLKTKFSLICLLTKLFYCQNSYAQAISNKDKSLDSLIGKKMADAGIVGMGATIIIDKKVAWTHGYGYADKENKFPFTPSTIMNIASISKTLPDFVS